MISEGGRTFPIFKRKNNSWSNYPATLEEALTFKQPAYELAPPETCTCGRRVVKFTDKSLIGNYCCTIDKAVTAYNSTFYDHPHSAKEAKIFEKDYFFTHKSCAVCGGLNKRALNGKCYFCVHKASPRRAAKLAGEAWYLPLEPCKFCGKIAPRRVNNGECKGCAVDKPLPPHRQWPGMIISREGAIEAGWKTYRTGKPCKNGHAGWRWVSNRGCLDCQRRE